MDLQNGVIRRHRLKCDIGMPSIACELAWFCEGVHSRSKALFLLDAANDADLVAELAIGFSDGMDMET